MKLHFFTPIFAAFAKNLSLKFRGWGRLNFNGKLLAINTLISYLICQKYIETMPAMSAFFLLVCSFQIYSGLMKLAALKKRLRNGNFQTVVSLLYAHYPISF